jgi:hypothetical protein
MKNSIITFVFSLIISISFGQEPVTVALNGSRFTEWSILTTDEDYSNKYFECLLNSNKFQVELYDTHQKKFLKIEQYVDSIGGIQRARQISRVQGITCQGDKFRVTFFEPGNYIIRKTDIKVKSQKRIFKNKSGVRLTLASSTEIERLKRIKVE